MKKLWSLVALGAALGLSVTFTSVSANGGGNKAAADGNDAFYDITVQAEFDHDGVGDSELSGTLFNTSVKNSYEDVVIDVDFYDDQNTLIDTRSFTVSDDVEKGEEEDFKISVQAPDGTESASWMISSADSDL